MSPRTAIRPFTSDVRRALVLVALVTVVPLVAGVVPRAETDGPFFVMVLRRGARLPMFALWVDNTEVMVEVEEPEDMRRMKKRPV